MSDSSGVMSGTSLGQRKRVVGVLNKCWCGAQIVVKISRTDANSYRCYYRCGYAYTHKLSDDNHTFKWVDEALLDEIETLALRTTRLEQNVIVITKESLEHHKLVFERKQMKLEKEIFERVEDVVLESKSSMKKIMIAIVVGWMIMLGWSKRIG